MGVCFLFLTLSIRYLIFSFLFFYGCCWCCCCLSSCIFYTLLYLPFRSTWTRCSALSTAHLRFGSFQVDNVCFHFYVRTFLSHFILCTDTLTQYTIYILFCAKIFTHPNCIQIIISHWITYCSWVKKLDAVFFRSFFILYVRIHSLTHPLMRSIHFSSRVETKLWYGLNVCFWFSIWARWMAALTRSRKWQTNDDRR